MSVETCSFLLSCPIDLLALITSKVTARDIRNLYLVDKSGLRQRLIDGGARSFCVEQDHNIQIFPSTVFKLKKLQELKLELPLRMTKPIVVELMNFLPQNLTSLSLRADYAQSCWLQLASNPQNQNQSPFHYKPILLDQTLPNLKHLSLRCLTWNEFNPWSFSGHFSLATPRFNPIYRSVLPKETIDIINGSLELQYNLTWTDEMRIQFLQHLPRGLVSLRLGVLSPFYCKTHTDIKPQIHPAPQQLASYKNDPSMQNSLELLPPHLTSLIVSDASIKENPVYLSMIPQSLKESLTDLTFGIVGTSENLDDDFPPNLISLNLCTYYKPICIDKLTSHLRFLQSLTFSNSSAITQWSLLPQSLTNLQLGSTSFSDRDIKYLPQKLTHLSLYPESSFAKLENFPDSLLTLKLITRCFFVGAEFDKLPKSLTALAFDGAPGCLNDSAPSYLPPNLVSLQLGKCSSGWSNLAIAKIPRSVRELTIIGSNMTTHCIPDLPPQLERLVLEGSNLLDDAAIDLLPKTLAELKLGVLRVTGRWLPEGETHVNTTNLTQSLLNHLPPLLRQTNISDLKLSFEYISYLPASVTDINLPCWQTGSCGPRNPQAELTYSTQLTKFGTVISNLPNLRHLCLPGNVDIVPADLVYFQNLETLVLPKNSKLANKKVIFPPKLKKLQVLCLTWHELSLLPPGLTYLETSKLQEVTDHPLPEFDSMTTLKISNAFEICDLNLSLLPRGLTELEIGNARKLTDACVSGLPSNLKILELPQTILSDNCFDSLPNGLTKLSIRKLRCQNPENYQHLPHMTTFASPNNFIHSLVEKQRKPDGTVPAYLNNLSVEKYVVQLPGKILGALPDSVTSLTFVSTHKGLDKDYFASLPRSIKYLDMSKQKGKYFTPEFMSSLPDGLETLITTCPSFMDPLLFSYLPRNLTKLYVDSVPGRLTPEKAQDLPRTLTSLRLGLILVLENALPNLPSGLLELDLPNSVLITDHGAKLLPKSLTTLKLPLAKLTSAITDHLSLNLKNLSLGIRSTPAQVILTGIYNRAKKLHDSN